MDYQLAIKRPFTDLKKLIIGILLSIIPIVNFLSIGYILESAKLTLSKKNNLPEWNNWGGLFWHGLLGLVISAIFMLPAIIVGVAGVGAGILKGLITSSVLEGLETGGPMIIAAGLLLLVSAYLLPAATLMFIQKWKFADAFKFGDMLKKVATSKYLVAWLVSLILGLVITVILTVIPLIGTAIGSFVSGVISITIMAQAFLEIK